MRKKRSKYFIMSITEWGTVKFIDDDLGGMDRENSHSIRLRSIMAKYNIAITPIA